MTASNLLPHPQPKSSHLSDPSLHPFLSPSFSATAYLNNTLPFPLTTATPLSKAQSTASTTTPAQSLTSIVSQTQSHISTLSAQTTRLSATLTALTDDILRRSSRLGYEIEVLRTDANSLVSSLSDPSNSELTDAIKTFLPDGITIPPPSPPHHQQQTQPPSTHNPRTTAEAEAEAAAPSEKTPSENTTSDPPIPLSHLRTLLRVRASLQKTTQVFSLALSWPMPPSLLIPTTNNLISITSPHTQQALLEQEAKGQAALSRLRAEIEELLAEGGDEGIEGAKGRVRELRECLEVWKGTGEEGGREKWVREVEGWVEEVGRERERGRRGVERGKGEEKGKVGKVEETSAPQRTGSGAGFLRRLRDEIYLE
ncbi:MAG: hypothetical protein LQ338_005189 [Usnochroma carphineum]|nr:MAG: hypothetical protein LQ338_005189 [Usnochroma carphineum]